MYTSASRGRRVNARLRPIQPLRFIGESDPTPMRDRCKQIAILLAIVCGVLGWSSHRIGQWIEVPLSLQVPSELPAGNFVTIPAESDYTFIKFGDVSPSKLSGHPLLFFAAGVHDPKQIEFFAYKNVDRVGAIMGLFKSPKIEFSRKVVNVNLPSAPVETEPVKLRLPSSVARTDSPENLERLEIEKQKMRELLAGSDGEIKMNCWIAPVYSRPTAMWGEFRTLPSGENYYHLGLDLRAALGTPVKAVGPGKVAGVGEFLVPGKFAVIDHGGGLFTKYMHLNEILSVPNEAVASGQMLGFSGTTGRSEGPHLHWEVSWKGRSIDPIALLRLSESFCPKDTFKEPDREPASLSAAAMAAINRARKLRQRRPALEAYDIAPVKIETKSGKRRRRR